jgi:hypothetical protein
MDKITENEISTDEGAASHMGFASTEVNQQFESPN